MKSNYNYFNMALLVFLILFMPSCKSKSEEHDHTSKNKAMHVQQKYHCPMHPEVTSDKPGICPKCEMDLELIPEEKDTLSYLVEPTNQVVISSLKPIVPSFTKGINQIKAEGYLTYNPNLTNSISARVSGRIERLYVKYKFERVHKGQLLLDLYSPELQTAQNEYLLIYKSATAAEKNILGALFQKLINLGMSDAAVKQIEKSGKVNATIPVYSPYDGHIHFIEQGGDIASHGLTWPSASGSDDMANDNVQAKLLIKEGDYVKKGDLLFTIANEKSIWAIFKILPKDIPLIQKGEEVEVKISNEMHNGKIDFIEKSFDGNTDFYTVRVNLNCASHNSLIIGTLIEGNVLINKEKSQLWIPNVSVLHLGKSRSAVFVKQKVGYIAKEVRTGTTKGDWTEVLFGISEHDSIAPVASYLVDSEAFIKVINQ